jgi:hypothetical protein
LLLWNRRLKHRPLVADETSEMIRRARRRSRGHHATHYAFPYLVAACCAGLVAWALRDLRGLLESS